MVSPIEKQGSIIIENHDLLTTGCVHLTEVDHIDESSTTIMRSKSSSSA